MAGDARNRAREFRKSEPDSSGADGQGLEHLQHPEQKSVRGTRKPASQRTGKVETRKAEAVSHGGNAAESYEEPDYQDQDNSSTGQAKSDDLENDRTGKSPQRAKNENTSKAGGGTRPKKLSTGKDDMADDAPENELKLPPLPALDEHEVGQFERLLTDTEEPEALVELLQSSFKIGSDHLQFLSDLGGAPKLREFYYQVIKFDWQYGTQTRSYISEKRYEEIAQKSPEDLAVPAHAKLGVKHRSSRTDTIVTGFNSAVGILRAHGVDPKEASVFDLGSGEGKAIAIAMSNNGKFRSDDSGENNFPFKKAVGVDYYAPVIHIARSNMKSPALQISADHRPVSFVFASAANYRDFNGVNVVYMYNPFGEDIMTRVEHNLRNYAGRTIVIYNKPLYGELFTSKGWKTEQTIESDDPDKRVTMLSWGFNGAANGNGTTATTTANVAVHGDLVDEETPTPGSDNGDGDSPAEEFSSLQLVGMS